MTSKPSSKLNSAQVELVLKRAADLEAAGRAEQDDVIDAGELQRLGQEAGLSPQAITQALAELDRGQLAPTKVVALERVLGDPFVLVSRRVPQSPAAASQALGQFMNTQLMVVDRNHGERVEWVRADGLFAGLGRSLRFAERYSFGPASRVETIVAPEDGGALVSFRVEMGAARKLGVAAISWRGAAMGGLGAVIAQGVADLATSVVCLGAAGLGVGLLWWRERAHFSQLRQQVALAPERFLDGLSAQPHAGPQGETKDAAKT